MSTSDCIQVRPQQWLGPPSHSTALQPLCAPFTNTPPSTGGCQYITRLLLSSSARTNCPAGSSTTVFSSVQLNVTLRSASSSRIFFLCWPIWAARGPEEARALRFFL